MPYRRISKRRSFKRKPAYRRRRYASKRKTYRRKTIFNRRILNVASIKKRDAIICAGTGDGGVTWNPSVASVPSDATVHTFLWAPTCMDLSTDENHRNRRSVYWKGVNDVMNFTMTGTTVWQWRRVIVANAFRYPSAKSTKDPQTKYRALQVDPPDATAFFDDVFVGTINQDWVEPFSATTDKERFRVLFDKTRYFRPKTDGGDMATVRQYISLNMNMSYDDEEVGGTRQSSPWCTESSKNNVYVFDMFQSNGKTNTPLSVNANATLYWHER